MNALVSSQTLDEIIEEVRSLQVQGAIVAWHIGRRLLLLYRDQLWKQSHRRDGAVYATHYKTFEHFCRTEFGITPHHAWSIMDVAERFSEEDVRLYGTTKLALVLRVRDEDQSKILKSIKEGAPRRELRELVTSLKSRSGYTRPTRDGASKGNRNTVAATLARQALRQSRIAKANIDQLVREIEKKVQITKIEHVRGLWCMHILAHKSARQYESLNACIRGEHKHFVLRGLS